jgi:hypothetical protein
MRTANGCAPDASTDTPRSQIDSAEPVVNMMLSADRVPFTMKGTHAVQARPCFRYAIRSEAS